MRTTLTLDDDLAMALHQKAHDEGRTFKDVVNDVLRRGLRESVGPRPVIEVKGFDMGFKPGINLVKANELAAQLEDEHILERMRAFEEDQARRRAGQDETS